MGYIGIDLGTTSVKVLLVNKNGEIIDSVSNSYPISYPKPNQSEQNPMDWWNACKDALKKLATKHSDIQIKTISFSGQMHGLVILDENDEVIRPCILWNDGRTSDECTFINEYDGGKVCEYTGNIAMTGFTAPKLLWVLRNEPYNYEKISKIMLPKDFIAYKLSKVFATDVSDASGMLLLDVKNRKWSQGMLDMLEISEEKLPKVFESYQSIGKIDEEIAKELCISPECKIVIGGGDQAVGAIGTGTVNDGECSISLGTSGVVFVPSSSYASKPLSGLHSFAHANGKYHFMGVMLSCAGALKWFFEDVLDEENYDDVLKKLNDDIDEKLLFLPYLTGERTPVNDPYARGSFVGLSITHTREDMLRCVIEGMCFGLCDSLELIKSTGTSIKTARVIGGASKSCVIMQILCDILNIKLVKLQSNEGGAFGACLLGMVADGLFSNVSDACKAFIKEDFSYTPNAINASIYAEKFKSYKKIYSAIKDI